jgi:hypothetical protein
MVAGAFWPPELPPFDEQFSMKAPASHQGSVANRKASAASLLLIVLIDSMGFAMLTPLLAAEPRRLDRNYWRGVKECSLHYLRSGHGLTR